MKNQATLAVPLSSAALLIALSGCSCPCPTTADAGADTATLDGATGDASPDALVTDTGQRDATPDDAPAGDAGPDDASGFDAPVPPVDASILDAPTLIDAPIAPLDAPTDTSCPSLPAGAVGGPCTTDAQCDSAVGVGDGYCLRGFTNPVTWPAEGFCVNQIDACTTDTECGAGNVCATIDDSLGPFSACLPACGTGACACPNGRLCATSFAGSPISGGDAACLPGDPLAVDGDPCVGFGECAADSHCRSDGLESPGGQCQRFGCTIGDDTTCAPGGDGHCVSLAAITTGIGTGTVCVDACTTDTDCRQSDGYECFDAGGTVGRFCRHPQAGDPCAVDADCGSAASWDCKIGVSFPGGMCTPTTGCPTPGLAVGCSPGSSICHDSVLPAVPTDNVCVDRCFGPIGTMGGCRAGYVCRDTNPGAAVALGCVNP